VLSIECDDKKLKILSVLTLIAVVWVFVVIMLGAYARLTNAGLSCPDWPGCYGHFMVTQGTQMAHKAWSEMVHRYVAGGLGLFIFIITLFSALVAVQRGVSFLVVGALLMLLVIYQVLLGMWTVTLQLLPLIVTQHLVTGMTVLSLLWYLHLKSSPRWHQSKPVNISCFKPWAVIALLLLGCQITLGAWTSTNYTVLSCEGFPVCEAMHWDFRHAFDLLSPIGVNYQGGTLNDAARMTIQMVHRIGAFVLSGYLILLSIFILAKLKNAFLIRTAAYATLLFLFLQLTLGILLVSLRCPVAIGIMHNVGAALLLIMVVTLSYLILGKPSGVNE